MSTSYRKESFHYTRWSWSVFTSDSWGTTVALPEGKQLGVFLVKENNFTSTSILSSTHKIRLKIHLFWEITFRLVGAGEQV